MEIQCPKCGETCAIDFEPEVGQHIVCPFCNTKFSYGETESATPRTVMAVCPYCGFAEPVDEQFSGHVGECSQCHGEFTIMPNARGIPFQPQTAAARQSSSRSGGSSSEGVLGFLLGFILGIFGVLLAVLIDKKKYLKASLWGLVGNLILGIIGAIILVNVTAGTVSSSGRGVIEVDVAKASEEEELLEDEVELAEKEVRAFTKMSRDIGRKAAGATKALSDEEGANARKAVEAIDRDRVRSFDE